MVIIERIGEIPLELQVDSLNHIKLKDISMHRCILNNLDKSYSILIEMDFRNAFMNNIMINNAILEKAKLILVESENSF